MDQEILHKLTEFLLVPLQRECEVVYLSAFRDGDAYHLRARLGQYPKTWSDRAKSLTLPRWFGWEAGLFLLAPQTSEDVQHSGHERIWARVRPERYGFKRWNIGFERPEDHPLCRQFLR